MNHLSEILPLYGAEHDMLLSKNGDITIAYALELPEIFTLSSAQFEAFHQSWVQAIRLLPAGTVLHKQDWYTEERYKGDFAKEHTFLSLSSERFFHERPFLGHGSYLMLTLKAKDRKAVNSLCSSLLRKHFPPMETLDPAFAKSFEGVCSQFVKVLADAGFVRCHRMQNKALEALVNRYLSLSADKVFRDLDFSDGIRIGEKHCVLFSLSDGDHLPAFCGPRIDYEKYSVDQHKFPVGFASPIGQLLSCDHVYSQYLVVEDSAVLMNQLESKRRRLQSLSSYSRENAFAKEAVGLYLNEAVAEGRQPVRAHFGILAWTEEPSALPAIRKLCAAALSHMDATPHIETVGAPQLFWAGIPGNAGDLPVNETFLSFSHQAACLLNLETNYRSSISPFGVRLADRINGRPLHVDLSDEPMRKGIITNRNKIVIGGSGTGKSFLQNHITHAYCVQGTHVVIVDIGHSYRNVCGLLGGYYYTHSETDPIRLNPFHIPEGGLPDTEKKESIKTLLVTLWKKDNEAFSRSEYVAISHALQGYYDKPVQHRSFNSFYEYVRDEFTGVLSRDKVREEDFDVAGFLYVLRPFYKGGEFNYLLNTTEQLDLLNQRFIVFELDTIKDHPILLPVVTIVIMELFIAKMRKLKGARKMIVIEEAWKAIAKNGMAEYIKYLFKTARKHFGEAVVVTQEIEDILSSDIIKQAIINNADMKILLDQSKYQGRFQEIQGLLGLPDSEVPKILSMNKANDPARNYKEVYIWPLGKVYHLEVSKEEYLAYTTEETEKHALITAVEKLGSVEAAIKSMVP